MNLDKQQYFNQNKKIYVYELNNTENSKNEKTKPLKPMDIEYKFNKINVYALNNTENSKNKKTKLLKPKDIEYKFNKININNNITIEDIDLDNESDNETDNECEEKSYPNANINNELYHLNINHLDDNNNWKNNSDSNYSMDIESEFIKSIKSIYLDESNELKKDSDLIFKIISETQKIKLDKGVGGLETLDKFITTTQLNKNKLYDGMTNITILTDNTKYQIESVKIIARAKNSISNDNFYRNIEWNLEFDKCDEGYYILGLDNFIHLGLVGLDEIFFDIVYLKNNIGFEDFDKFGWLKFTRCYYNQIIKTNLEKNLYQNEESYSVDIVDWIYSERIDIDLEEKKFNHIYNCDYNILKIMSGMSGIAYSS
jgi:hypothetical protein